MTQNQKTEAIKKAVAERRFCAVRLMYEHTERHMIPIAAGKDRFIAVNESDLKLDGYILIDFRQVDAVYMLSEASGEIARNEGFLDAVRIPPVDLDSPRMIFSYLANSGTNIEVEVCSDASRETAIFPGRVVGTTDYEFRLLIFNVSCTWEKRPVTIGYDRLRAVKFGTGYLDIYSKYLPTCPVIPQ
ncbi:MAG: hypothetical protein MJ137_06760 [Clostridia bacterium]|nr:hypothetical protein [Clostridia bacterium]